MHINMLRLVCLLVFVFFRIVVHAVSPLPLVPGGVQALVGSCVVIPCSFTPPVAHRPPRGRREKVDIRLRFRSPDYSSVLWSTAFNSKDRDQVSRDFRGRTSLFGQVEDGDCSVKLENVRMDDALTFEIALRRGDDLTWGKSRGFTLHVVDTPEAPVISGMLAATEGQLVTLNCSVSYPCPSRPPSLQWSWPIGEHPNDIVPGEVRSVSPEPHRPMLLAPLSFSVSHQVKPRVKCEATYPGAQSMATSRNLYVTFPPKEVNVQIQSVGVHEGGTALLTCACKADPPASEYHWSYTHRGHTVHLHQRTHTVRLYNVTRDMRVRCTAHNLIGRGESQPRDLNVQYKPAIVEPYSSCLIEDMEVLCHCSVNSYPESTVTWSINGTAPTRDFNLSMTSESHLQTATLRGQMSRTLTVTCFAVNDWGNDSVVLLQRSNGEVPLWWMVAPAAALCSLIFLLSLLFYCWRKRAATDVLNKEPTASLEPQDVCQDRMPLYINCTEVSHVYNNGSYQLVYQNCTPLFVHTKQIHPVARRGGKRRKGRRRRQGKEAVGVQVQEPTAVTEAETAVYLEIA